MNEKSAKEWLNKAWHHLSSAKILFEVHHYTDTIAVDLHYAVEVTLKAFLAYENKKIPKTHDLIELHAHVRDKIDFNEDELALLDKITNYHIKGSYPPHDKFLPQREEIQEVLIFSEHLFNNVCKSMLIKLSEVQK